MKNWKRSIFALSIAVLLLSMVTFATNCRQDTQLKETVQQLNDLHESHNEHLMDFNQILHGYQGGLKVILEALEFLG